MKETDKKKFNSIEIKIKEKKMKKEMRENKIK